jgi:PleD family two-component response regulator
VLKNSDKRARTLWSARLEKRIIEWINHGLFDPNHVLVEVQSVRRDVTEIEKSQNGARQAHGKLEHIAHYDLLTDLPDRILLADRLSHDMKQCQCRNQSLAVVYMDLDAFNVVNDTMAIIWGINYSSNCYNA